MKNTRTSRGPCGARRRRCAGLRFRNAMRAGWRNSGADRLRRLTASGGERRLGLLGDRLERRRLVDREIREHLAVDGDAGLGQAVDKHAVGHAERADGSVKTLNPQRAEGALLALAIAEGILPGLFDRGLGGPDRVLAAAVKALGGLVDFLVLGGRGHPAFAASHDRSPSSLKIE